MRIELCDPGRSAGAHGVDFCAFRCYQVLFDTLLSILMRYSRVWCILCRRSLSFWMVANSALPILLGSLRHPCSFAEFTRKHGKKYSSKEEHKLRR